MPQNPAPRSADMYLTTAADVPDQVLPMPACVVPVSDAFLTRYVDGSEHRRYDIPNGLYARYHEDGQLAEMAWIQEPAQWARANSRASDPFL